MGASTPCLSFVTAAGLAIAWQPCVAGSLPASCPVDLKPIHTVVPKLPIRTEVVYEGTAEVAVTIDRHGRVSNARLTSNHVRNVLGGDTAGVDVALLEAVKRWRYAPRHSACRKTLTIDLKY